MSSKWWRSRRMWNSPLLWFHLSSGILVLFSFGLPRKAGVLLAGWAISGVVLLWFLLLVRPQPESDAIPGARTDRATASADELPPIRWGRIGIASAVMLAVILFAALSQVLLSGWLSQFWIGLVSPLVITVGAFACVYVLARD